MQYAIIFASTVRDPPPFPSGTHSSILLLWQESCAALKAALFLAEMDQNDRAFRGVRHP